MTIATRCIGYCCAIVVAVCVLTPRDGAAQTQNTTKAPAAAVALEKQANSLLSTPKKWVVVARSLERAAEIRGQDDPQAIKDLFLAAAARVWINNLLEAQVAFTQAADWALANGDVEVAATGYTRASVSAFQRKDIVTARQLRDQAARLARSPLLSAVQKQSILNQFVQPSTSIAAGH